MLGQHVPRKAGSQSVDSAGRVLRGAHTDTQTDMPGCGPLRKGRVESSSPLGAQRTARLQSQLTGRARPGENLAPSHRQGKARGEPAFTLLTGGSLQNGPHSHKPTHSRGAVSPLGPLQGRWAQGTQQLWAAERGHRKTRFPQHATLALTLLNNFQYLHSEYFYQTDLRLAFSCHNNNKKIFPQGSDSVWCTPSPCSGQSTADEEERGLTGVAKKEK